MCPCVEKKARGQIFSKQTVETWRSTKSCKTLWKSGESRSVVSASLRSHGLYSPWNSPTRILEWVAIPFSRGSSQPRDPTQVSRTANGFFNLSHKGSPRILERVAYPFPSGSSRPRDQTQVSRIAGGFFTALQGSPNYELIINNQHINIYSLMINDQWINRIWSRDTEKR